MSGSLIGPLKTFSNAVGYLNKAADLNDNFNDVKSVVNGGVGSVNFHPGLTLAEIGGNLSSGQTATVLSNLVVKTGTKGSLSMSNLGADGWHHVPSTAGSSGTWETVTFAAPFADAALTVRADLNALKSGVAQFFFGSGNVSGVATDEFRFQLSFNGDLTSVPSWNAGYPVLSYRAVGR